MRIAKCSAVAALALIVSIVSCDGSGAGPTGASATPTTAQFELITINVPTGATWQINRAIKFSFNAPVDLGSVNSSTVEIATVSGVPAAGEYFLDPADAKTVVFQPRCPLALDLSDAGLTIGGVRYLARAVGTGSGAANTVLAADGRHLANTMRHLFKTPVSHAQNIAFIDTKVGPPQALVRDANSAAEGTYVEFGGDPTQRAYFERDPATGVITLAPNADLPLNLLSDTASHVALVIVFDQAVNPGVNNVNSQLLRWEYRDVAGAWHPLATNVELASNCSGPGASVRIEPIGILPPATDLRGVVDAAFGDITGEANILPQNAFAPARTQAAPVPLADDVLEEFASPANQDTTSVFVEPRALWANNELTASTGFTGTGGPGGNFDWEVPAGQTLVFDTQFTTITGGPGFAPTTQQACVGGIVQVRNMRIAAGATVKVQGPNPLVILAGGKVQILGVLDVGGTSSPGVNTLNTTNFSEPGATGQAGGGRGGIGNPITNALSPTGGPGQGAFGGVDLGGQGGEAGWSATANENQRRGAGGGGGRFGGDVLNTTLGIGLYDQRRIGLDAEPGFDNRFGDNGALHPGQHPVGGAIGASPFVDADPTNDFYGRHYDVNTQTSVAGELAHPWAGSGGGGGGNAVQAPGGTFPPPWTSTGDEKGAGGGGGAGALHVVALGPIEFGAAGQVRARGGNGGGGENTLFLNRLGGGSGGGAGGHVILESASRIDMHSNSANNLAIVATGGQGGAGSGDTGGATQTLNGSVQTTPAADACPPGYATTGPNPCRGAVDGAGGDGGPGLIQLHTPTGHVANSVALGGDILVPFGLALSQVCAPPPLDPTGSVGGKYMLPSVSSRSRARSQWIALGHGGFDAQAALGAFKPVSFQFDGVDPATGLVATTAGEVNVLAPIVGPLALQSAPALPRIEPDGYTLTFDATALAASPNAYLLANDDLLRRSLIVLAQSGTPANRALFDVNAASYDSATNTLALVADGNGPPLTSFAPGGTVEASLSPAYFRAGAGNALGVLPAGTSIRCMLQATKADASGAPDLSAASPLTADVSVLNALANANEIRFVRFEVLFDADAAQQGLSIDSPLPFLDFFKTLFRY